MAQRDREKEGDESRGYLHAAPIRLKVVTAAATAKDPRHTHRAVRAPATHKGGGAEEHAGGDPWLKGWTLPPAAIGLSSVVMSSSLLALPMWMRRVHAAGGLSRTWSRSAMASSECDVNFQKGREEGQK